MVKTTPDSPAGISPRPSMTVKRKKNDEQESSSAKKKPRTRVSYSCGECHRRKQKCDRQMPCSHCIARKVPDLCTPYTPGKSDQDINARLSRLEHIIDAALPQYAHLDVGNSPPFPTSTIQSGIESRSTSPEGDTGTPPEDQGPPDTFQSGKWYGRTASGSIAPASVLQQLQNVSQPQSAASIKSEIPFLHPPQSHDRTHLPPTNQASSSQMPNGQSSNILYQNPEPTAAEKLQSLIRDCQVSPQSLTELISDLPPGSLTDQLVDYYFQCINWTRYPISEDDFRVAYQSLKAEGPDVSANGIRFLPLLFVVLAIAVRLAPEDLGGNAHDRRIRSVQFYWTSRRCLLIAAAIQVDSLELVLTRLLSARFLTFDRRITECWAQLGAAVRTAQAIGLHRDGALMRMDPAQVEYRRRIWAYLYHADRSYALVLGRPSAIQDDYTSTSPPLNIEDASGLPSNNISMAPPLSAPTRVTFVILRHALASIIGRMVHHFQRVRHSHYADVIAIDDDLQRFIDTLPPHFALNPDKSLDATLDYIPTHRYLLITEIMFVRTSFHRPYLLRRLGSDRYARSRQACFSSALTDFRVRQEFRRTTSKDTYNPVSNAYRDFQTAMIAGIYLVLDPRGKDADGMHGILDRFLADHEGMDEMDDTTRRELKFIEFLKAKSTNNAPLLKQLMVPTNGDDTDQSLDAQANLLLSLQQPQTGTPRPSPLKIGGSLPLLPNIPPRTIYTPLSMKSPPLGSATPAHGPSSPTAGFSKPQSPTMQRVQVDVNVSSPASGSPTADEEPAQSLLDHWYNVVSNGPIADPLGGIEGPSPGQWTALATGTGDVPSWLAGIPLVYPASDPVSSSEGSDWTYWETLVNQIRGPL